MKAFGFLLLIGAFLIAWGLGDETRDVVRAPLIMGNWKMNTDLPSAITLAKSIGTHYLSSNKKVEVAVCPPFPFLHPVLQAVEGTGIQVGAQNSYPEKKGAFTGAVSAPMLHSMGVHYVLAGHSERRTIFKETDDQVNREVKSILAEGMTPVLCIGESRQDYELGLNKEVCTLQLTKGLADLSAEEVSKVVIAYEPLWAIGTGLTATPQIAQSVHATVRKWLAQRYGEDVAKTVRVLYGGSVTPDTIGNLMAEADIDGVLVGGASLLAESFIRMIDQQQR